MTILSMGVCQFSKKSSIKITSPNSSTVWTIPNKAALSWETMNIPEDKTIQFYLFKGELVVQELGIFKNNKFVDGIELNKSLASGNNYRVIGIELFPDNKLSIAKFATPLFTIKKAPRKKPEVVEASLEKKKY